MTVLLAFLLLALGVAIAAGPIAWAIKLSAHLEMEEQFGPPNLRAVEPDSTTV
jgi:hypothetical protein